MMRYTITNASADAVFVSGYLFANKRTARKKIIAIRVIRIPSTTIPAGTPIDLKRKSENLSDSHEK